MTTETTHDQPAAERGAEALTLTALHEANIARQNEWCPDQLPDLSFRGNELAGEAGEASEALVLHAAELGRLTGRASNVVKKLERERYGWRGSRATKEHLAEELADVVICADLCAITAGIDLAAAVIVKFNTTSDKQGFATRLPLSAALSRSPDAGRGAPTEPLADLAGLSGAPPDVESFCINPLGGPDIIVEGSRRFVHESDFQAYKAWAETTIGRLLPTSSPSVGAGRLDREGIARAAARRVIFGIADRPDVLWDADQLVLVRAGNVEREMLAILALAQTPASGGGRQRELGLSAWLAEADQLLHDLLETSDPAAKQRAERAHYLIHEIAHAVAALTPQGTPDPDPVARAREGEALMPEEPTETMERAFEDAYWAKSGDIASPTPTELPEDGGGPFGYGYRAMRKAALRTLDPVPASTAADLHASDRGTRREADGRDLPLAEQAQHHGRDWKVWWQGSGERGDHIMELAQSGLGYARELAWIGDQYHDQASVIVAEHNEQVRRLREVIARQAAAKSLLQAELGRIKAIIPASLSYEVPDAAEAIASTFREYVKVAAEAAALRKAAQSAIPFAAPGGSDREGFGLDWELSDETRATLAEIDRATVVAPWQTGCGSPALTPQPASPGAGERERITCDGCSADITAAFWMCDKLDGKWCRSCFGKCPCPPEQSCHGKDEGCPTFTVDAGPPTAPDAAEAEVEKPPFRTGDIVLHGPSNETWTVAYADPVSGDIAWCGWPEGLARLADCTLVAAATDDQHLGTLQAVIQAGGMRARGALRIHGAPPSTGSGDADAGGRS